MEIGSRIHELRKNHKLSQEQLAEKVGVSRQTISKWELGETAPDIKQAKLLSQIFGVSLDELTDNDTKEVIYQKVSNTEKLSGMIINILKILGAFILLSIVATVISIVLFTTFRVNNPLDSGVVSIVISENIGEEKYHIEIREDGTVISQGLSDEMRSEIFELIDFDDLEATFENIESYFAELQDNAG